MAGMVGSKQGWVNCPYLACPAASSRIASSLVRLPPTTDGWRDVHIIGGLKSGAEADPSSSGTDVMRGEETQLLGLIKAHGLEAATVCMPGAYRVWLWLHTTPPRSPPDCRCLSPARRVRIFDPRPAPAVFISKATPFPCYFPCFGGAREGPSGAGVGAC